MPFSLYDALIYLLWRCLMLLIQIDCGRRLAPLPNTSLMINFMRWELFMFPHCRLLGTKIHGWGTSSKGDYSAASAFVLGWLWTRSWAMKDLISCGFGDYGALWEFDLFFLWTLGSFKKNWIRRRWGKVSRLMTFAVYAGMWQRLRIIFSVLAHFTWWCGEELAVFVWTPNLSGYWF